MKKIMATLMCVLLLVTVIPFAHSFNSEQAQTTEDKKDANSPGIGRVFTTCYVEALGSSVGQVKSFWFRPFRNDFAIVSIWKIFYGDCQTTIYNKKNGDVLWEHQGQHNLFLIGFRGEYIYCGGDCDDEPTHTIRGKALLVRPSFFPKP
jgi:hypothetical protein